MGLLVDRLEHGRYTKFTDSYQQAGERHLNYRGKALAVIAVAAAGFGIFSDEGLGFWGHGTKERTPAAMNAEARAKYELVLQQASLSQLFALRYTDQASLSVRRTAQGHSGIYGHMFDNNIEYDKHRIYSVGDQCLNDTAYDINGGQLHFNVRYNGLFSGVDVNATGDTPTAAAQARYYPEKRELVIKSGNTNSDNLRFEVNYTRLIPGDETTKDVLTTYGCKPDVQYSFENGE